MVQFAPKVEYDILQKHVFSLKINIFCKNATYFSCKCQCSYMFLKKRVGKLVCSKRHTVKTTIELYKYLDEDNQRLLARILNQMWTEESYPANFAYAEVVSLYKKGNPELPEHYRPIFFAELIKQHFDQICTEKTCRRH